jgi:hypothetical protein
MTVAILVLLVCLILVSFKTVRMIIGIFVFLGILGYLYGPKGPTYAQVPQTTVAAPAKPEPKPELSKPEPQTIRLPDVMLNEVGSMNDGWCSGPLSIELNDMRPEVASRTPLHQCPDAEYRWHKFMATETGIIEVVGITGWLRCKAKSIMTISDEYIVKWDCTELSGGRAYNRQRTNKLRIEQGKLITTHVAAPKE